ncbi:hypothetical protein QYF61_017284 [Mycteria americana]|uniref:Uncharacterized protein n=1 Tax=Mycteria americana TaxID=33587 RepID=A0AAN7S039_MYCAM|nr:hypothetical protein QYF61_017284 [Mycteria americana]
MGAALNPLIAKPVSMFGIALTQVQDLALGLVELHEVRMGPPLKPVKVPLDGISSLLESPSLHPQDPAAENQELLPALLLLQCPPSRNVKPQMMKGLVLLSEQQSAVEFGLARPCKQFACRWCVHQHRSMGYGSGMREDDETSPQSHNPHIPLTAFLITTYMSNWKK